MSDGIRTWFGTFVTNGTNHSSAVVRSRIGFLRSKSRDRKRWKDLLSSAATYLCKFLFLWIQL